MTVYSKRFATVHAPSGNVHTPLAIAPAGTTFVVRFISAWSFVATTVFIELKPAGSSSLFTMAAYKTGGELAVERDVRYVLGPGDELSVSVASGDAYIGAFGYDLAGVAP